MQQTQQENAGPTGSVLESAAEMLHNEAADLGRDAKRISSEVLEQRVDQVFGFLGHIEKAVRAAARELENEHHVHIACYIDQAADEVANARDRFQSTNLEDFVRSAENMARARPIAAVGLAFAAGFAFVRFLKSSTPESLPGSYGRPESRSSQGSGSWSQSSQGQVRGGYDGTYGTRSRSGQGRAPQQQPTKPSEHAGYYAGAGDNDEALNEQQSHGTGSSGQDSERRGSTGAAEHTGAQHKGDEHKSDALGSENSSQRNVASSSRRFPAED